jgi:hypothetical protein
MKLTELPVSIKASALYPLIVIGDVAFLRLFGEAAEIADRAASHWLLSSVTALALWGCFDRHTLAKWPFLEQSWQHSLAAGHLMRWCTFPPQKKQRRLELGLKVGVAAAALLALLDSGKALRFNDVLVLLNVWAYIPASSREIARLTASSILRFNFSSSLSLIF